MRIAVYNVENLFDRAKAMNLETWEDGRPILEKFAELNTLLGELADEGVTHAAMEASSHGLDQSRLDGVEQSAAGFTNLGRDHMDYHPTMEDYMAAKMRLFDTLLPKGAPAVIFADDAWSDEAIRVATAAGHDVRTVGRKGTFLSLKRVEHFRHKQVAEVHHGDQIFEVHIPLAGDFQIANALVSAGLTVAELADAARAAAAGGRGFLWALAKAEGQRRDAARVGVLPDAAPAVDPDSRVAIEADGERFGLGWWNAKINLYGHEGTVKAQVELIRKLFEPRLGPLKFELWRQGDPEDLSAQGVPTTMGLQCVNWYGGRGGHLSFAPVLPQDGDIERIEVKGAMMRQIDTSDSTAGLTLDAATQHHERVADRPGDLIGGIQQRRIPGRQPSLRTT